MEKPATLHLPPSSMRIELQPVLGSGPRPPLPGRSASVALLFSERESSADAFELAKGVKLGARGAISDVELVEVSDGRISADIVLALDYVPAEVKKPTIAWIRKGSTKSILDVRKLSHSLYAILHPGRQLAQSGHASFMPHAITSRQIFKPMSAEKAMEVVYSGPDGPILEELRRNLRNVLRLDTNDPRERARELSRAVVAVVVPEEADAAHGIFPRTAIEAVACGTPVVTSSWWCPEDLEDFIVFDLEAKLVERTRELVMNPVKRSRLIRDPKASWHTWTMEARGREIGQEIKSIMEKRT